VITARAFAGKTYGVYGLARTGKAVAAALAASGAGTLCWDDGEAARAGFDGELTDLNTADLAGLAAIVTSPGVPLATNMVAARARAAGVPVIGDIELFALARPELPPHKVVGITGTNGKSTTTALIHHLLETGGIGARMGGNIGLPIMSQRPLVAGGVYVLELSSFQLDLTMTLNCDVAVLLNITPDHLDRHGDMAGYAAAKARLFEQQSAGHVAVFASADPWTQGIAAQAPGRVVQVSARDVAGQADWPALQGPHNAQNAAAAIAAVRALGMSEAAIAEGLRSYPGLPHRMERVAEKHGVLYVNDSKATNPDSTAPALAAYPRIHWIAGGRAKGDSLDALTPHLGHVAAAYLIGEAAEPFARLLRPRLPVTVSGTLERAVPDAAAAAKPGDTVLLSPACASYDQFRDFEARGARFRELVEALP
jgi:UDP-N-acetylmuramoylalanine--D-glutamate ligase